MKRLVQRTICLGLLLALSLVFPAGGKAFAAGKINASLSAEGILTWEDYPGAAALWLEINGGSVMAGTYTTESEPNRIDLKSLIDGWVDPLSGNYDPSFQKKSSYEILLFATDSEGETIAKSDPMTLHYQTKADEHEPLEASLSSKGILTWKPYPGAVSYSVGVNGYSVSVGMNCTADVKQIANEVFANPVDDFQNTGTIKVELMAIDERGWPIQTWTGSLKYTAKRPMDTAALTATGFTDQTYTGKAIKLPKLVMKYNGVKLKNGTDYTLSYSNNKNIGMATVKITGKGTFSGTVKWNFRINPKGLSLKKVKAGKKSFTATWKKQSAKLITGYQLQYATKKNFSDAVTVTVAPAKIAKAAVKKLKSKKTYYVRIAAFKKIQGDVYLSAWSKAKKVKVK